MAQLDILVAVEFTAVVRGDGPEVPGPVCGVHFRFPNEAHTAFVKTDGTVWITGGNSYGQLGSGGIAKSDYPIQLNLTPAGAPVTGATSISAGTSNSLFLVSKGSTYATWLADTAPSLIGADKLTSADPDGDSIPNLLEYILGGQPTQPDPGSLPGVAVSRETRSGSLTFIRNASSTDDSILAYEYSCDLTNWTSVEIGPTSAPPGVTLGTPDSNGRQTITITLPSTPTKRFVRLKAKLQ